MASKDRIWLVIMLVFSFECFSKVQGIESQTNNVLYSDWFSKWLWNSTRDYGNLLSPAITAKDPFSVNLSLTVTNLHDLDEVTGTLTVNGWLTIMWFDPRLTWNPVTIGVTNKTSIDLKSYHVWTPDIVLENHIDSFSTQSNPEVTNTKLAVFSNGKIDWTFQVTLKASCPVDHRYYPFDAYVCELRLISHTRDYSEISLRKISTHNHHNDHGENTLSNPVWTISKQKSEIVHTLKRKHNGHHFAYQHTMHLRRHSPGQKFTILMPILLAMGITLSVFWISPTSGKRIPMGGIAVLIFLIMLLYLGWKIPAGGRHIPLVVFLCGISLLMAGMSLIISVIVWQLNTFNSYRPVPEILKSFLGRRRIRQLCCMNFPKPQMGDDGMQLLKNCTDATAEAQPSNSTSDADSNLPTLTEWTLIAYVTDRMAFVIYCLVFAILLFSFSV